MPPTICYHRRERFCKRSCRQKKREEEKQYIITGFPDAEIEEVALAVRKGATCAYKIEVLNSHTLNSMQFRESIVPSKNDRVIIT